MKKGILIAAGIVGFTVLLYWMSLENATQATHIHFTGQTGYLTDVIYYSDKLPEKGPQHTCDNRFAEMPDGMFNSQLERWRSRNRPR